MHLARQSLPSAIRLAWTGWFVQDCLGYVVPRSDDVPQRDHDGECRQTTVAILYVNPLHECYIANR